MKAFPFTRHNSPFISSVDCRLLLALFYRIAQTILAGLLLLWFWFWLTGSRSERSETKTWPYPRRRLANVFPVAVLPNGHQVQLFYDFLLTNKLLKGYAHAIVARMLPGMLGLAKCICSTASCWNTLP